MKRKSSTLITKSVTSLLLLIYFAFNVSYAAGLYKKTDPLPYLTGEISREEYLSNHLPYYSLNQLANEAVTENGKLLGVYTGFRRYYLNVPHTLESKLLVHLAKKVTTANALAEELSKYQITHILMRVDVFNNSLGQEKQEVQALIADFFKNNATLLDAKDRFSLYKIK
jgi:hypothetical protein